MGSMITWGMVSIPVSGTNAIKEHGRTRSSLHKQCMQMVSGKGRWCATCQADVEDEDVTTGMKISSKQFVEITEEDIATLPHRTTDEISILKTVPAESIDPILYERIEYLVPDPKVNIEGKAFALFREGLLAENRVAVAMTSKSAKQMLCVIQPKGRILQMARIHWNDEIRELLEFEAAVPEVQLSDAEIAAAGHLIAAMAGTFQEVVDSQRDEYNEELTKLVEAKAAGQTVVFPPVAQAAKVDSDDLMKLLEASIAVASK